MTSFATKQMVLSPLRSDKSRDLDLWDDLLTGILKHLLRLSGVSNSYTVGCPPVCRDNPRALVSGLSCTGGQT